IWLSVERQGADAIFRVRDSGMGIPREMLGKVFDLFTQVDSSLDRAQGGLGIGLTMVRRLVELHGGSVQAFSDGPGQGAELVVRCEAVVLDIGLPGMDGYEVARRLRAEPETREVLLIAASGYGQEEDRQMSQEAGFNHHLVKPVDYAALERLLPASPRPRLSV